MIWGGRSEVRSHGNLQKGRSEVAARNPGEGGQSILLFKDNPRHPSLGVKRIQGFPMSGKAESTSTAAHVPLRSRHVRVPQYRTSVIIEDEP